MVKEAAEVGVLDMMGEGATAMSVHSENITIDAQVATAKRFPRNVQAAQQEAMAAATTDVPTAASMFYTLTKGRSQIIGPSARLAEIMIQAWGNVRADIEPLEAKSKHVTAMATCFDVEKNVAIRMKVHRRITDKHDNRYNDDMIQTTFMAAASIAYRNAVLKTVPTWVWRPVYEAALRVAGGDENTITERRASALAWFTEREVDPARVLAFLGLETAEHISPRHIVILLGIASAVESGETTLRSIFAPPSADPPTEGLNDALDDENPEASPVPTEEPREAPAPTQSPEDAESEALQRKIRGTVFIKRKVGQGKYAEMTWQDVTKIDRSYVRMGLSKGDNFWGWLTDEECEFLADYADFLKEKETESLLSRAQAVAQKAIVAGMLDLDESAEMEDAIDTARDTGNLAPVEDWIQTIEAKLAKG